jgi:hypothetical protein
MCPIVRGRSLGQLRMTRAGALVSSRSIRGELAKADSQSHMLSYRHMVHCWAAAGTVELVVAVGSWRIE